MHEVLEKPESPRAVAVSPRGPRGPHLVSSASKNSVSRMSAPNGVVLSVSSSGPSDTTVSGYLFRKFPAQNEWRKKFFVLRSKILTFYENEEGYTSSMGLGFIDLSFMKKAQTASREQDLWCFDVEMLSGKVWNLGSTEPEKVIMWLNHIIVHKKTGLSASMPEVSLGGAGGISQMSQSAASNVPPAPALPLSPRQQQKQVAVATEETEAPKSPRDTPKSPRASPMVQKNLAAAAAAVALSRKKDQEGKTTETSTETSAPPAYTTSVSSVTSPRPLKVVPSPPPQLSPLRQHGASLVMSHLALYDSELFTENVQKTNDKKPMEDQKTLRLKNSLVKILSYDDERFYDEYEQQKQKSDIDSQLSEIERVIFDELFEDAPMRTFDPDNDSLTQDCGLLVDMAVAAAIKEHLGQNGILSDEAKVSAYSKLRSRCATLADKTTTTVPTLKKNKSGTLHHPIPLEPLPDTPPSIHDHEAYREYIKLKKAHRDFNLHAAGAGGSGGSNASPMASHWVRTSPRARPTTNE